MAQKPGSPPSLKPAAPPSVTANGSVIPPVEPTVETAQSPTDRRLPAIPPNLDDDDTCAEGSPVASPSTRTAVADSPVETARVSTPKKQTEDDHWTRIEPRDGIANAPKRMSAVISEIVPEKVGVSGCDAANGSVIPPIEPPIETAQSPTDRRLPAIPPNLDDDDTCAEGSIVSRSSHSVRTAVSSHSPVANKH